MDDHAFQRGAFARIGHPEPLIGVETRCACAAYSLAAVPRIPGPNLSLADRPEVSMLEHRLGLHFHKCLLAGMSTQGHNAVSHAWLRALKKLGYTGEVFEVPLGVDAKTGNQIKGDGLAKNWAVSAVVHVWDTRVSSSYLPALLKKASATMYAVTDHNELLKIKEKDAACRRCLQGRAAFIPVVCNSHGGLGRRAHNFLNEAFQRKIDDAADPTAKRAAQLEWQTTLAEIACAVLNRNSFIMAANVRGPVTGGAPPPNDLFEGMESEDVMQDDV